MLFWSVELNNSDKNIHFTHMKMTDHYETDKNRALKFVFVKLHSWDLKGLGFALWYSGHALRTFFYNQYQWVVLKFS